MPKRILVHKGLEGSAVAVRAAISAPGCTMESFGDLTEALATLERMGVKEAKSVLVVARRSGGFVKEFPVSGTRGASKWHYFIPAMGCPADCRYCFLQSYHRSGAPVVFADCDSMLAEIETKSRQLGGGYFYGGELCDDLMLEQYLEMAPRLFELFATLPAATLELRTKSADVSSILSREVPGNVIVSWTFSPQSVVERYEPGTASQAERIQAARAVQNAGVRVGIRLDPVILEEGWREAYEGLIGELASALEPKLVESVHIGCLRFTAGLKSVVTARFGPGAPFSDEFVLCGDGKYRYPRPLRVSAYSAIDAMVRRWSPEIKVSLCMESDAIAGEYRALVGARPSRTT